MVHEFDQDTEPQQHSPIDEYTNHSAEIIPYKHLSLQGLLIYPLISNKHVKTIIIKHKLNKKLWVFSFYNVVLLH